MAWHESEGTRIICFWSVVFVGWMGYEFYNGKFDVDEPVTEQVKVAQQKPGDTSPRKPTESNGKTVSKSPTEQAIEDWHRIKSSQRVEPFLEYAHKYNLVFRATLPHYNELNQKTYQRLLATPWTPKDNSYNGFAQYAPIYMEQFRDTQHEAELRQRYSKHLFENVNHVSAVRRLFLANKNSEYAAALSEWPYQAAMQSNNAENVRNFIKQWPDHDEKYDLRMHLNRLERVAIEQERQEKARQQARRKKVMNDLYGDDSMDLNGDGRVSDNETFGFSDEIEIIQEYTEETYHCKVQNSHSWAKASSNISATDACSLAMQRCSERSGAYCEVVSEWVD